MDSPALWFSTALLAVRLAMACWFALLALSLLDRRWASLAWQVGLAAAIIGCSWWGGLSLKNPTWCRPVWMVQSGLAAVIILNCLRRWVAGPPSTAVASGVGGRKAHGWIHWIVALTGASITALVLLAVVQPQPVGAGLFPSSLAWPVILASMHLLTCAVLLAIALVVALELTLGALGSELLELPWKRLSAVTSIAWLVQLVLAGCLLRFKAEGPGAMESLMPIVFALAMIALGYILWMITWRLTLMARQQKLVGQVSLAMAAWLAVLGLSVASGLPSGWPWMGLRWESGSGPAFSSMEQ